MMEEENQSPLKKAAPTLEQMSIEELEARIERLRQDILDCEAVLVAKRSHRSAADALFGGRA